MKTGQQSAAKKEFELALNLEPGNVYTEYFLAQILFSENQVDKAIQLYESILKSGTPIYDTNQRLGQAYARNGQLAKAEALTQQAIQETPWDGALHYQLAKIYQRLGRTKEAQREFEAGERMKQTDQASIERLLQLSQAVRLKQPENVQKLRAEILDQSGHDPELLTWLGVLLGRGGLYTQAQDALEKAVAIKPDSFEAHYNLGLTLARQGDDQRAEASLKKALNLRPESPEVAILLGVLYANQGRNREAIEELRTARPARPDNVTLLTLLGQQYLQGWYLKDAIGVLQEASRLRPDDPKIRFLLIEAYQNSSAYDQALQLAREAQKLFPAEARAPFEVGHQMANLGHYQEARPFFEEAIRIDPSFVPAYNSLGDAQVRSGEYEGALRSYQKAKTLEPGNLDAARGLGRSLLRLKRYPDALKELQGLIALHPEDAELYLLLSQVQTRLGNSKEAAQANANVPETPRRRSCKTR